MTAPPDPTSLTRRIAGLSSAKRALLERMIENTVPVDRAARPERSAGVGAERPLSFAQQRLWILDQFEPGDAAYNRPIGFRFGGPLDRGALERCLAEVARRHDVLRATFPAVDGRPVQRIAPFVPIPLPLVDLHDIPSEAREGRARSLAVEEAERAFDLAAGPLVRAALYRIGDEDHILLVVFHHIVFDAWSGEVLWREIAALYHAFASDAPSPLAELPIQYSDVAAFERQRLANGALADGLAYWRGRLEPPPPHLCLPADRPEPDVVSSRGAHRSTVLPLRLVESLRALGRQEGATLFMVLLAAWQALLHRISGEADIAVGTPVAGRSAADTEALIGCFVNTLVLRTDLSADPTFRVLLRRVRGVAVDGYTRDYVPFDRVVAAVPLARDSGRSALFRTFLNLRNVPRSRPAPAGLTMSSFEVLTRTTRFDLSLDITEESAGLTSVLSFATDLFDEATIAALLDSWHALLEGIVADPERRLSALPILPKAERRRVLFDWNQTRARYPDRPIHRLFEEQATRTPDAVALVQGHRRCTYGELNVQANRLAHFISEKVGCTEAPVGVFLDRSIEATTALLGVLKAGAAFLPLDPGYPSDRIGYMLEDAGVSLVLTEERLAPLLPATKADVIRVDAVAAHIARQSAEDPSAAARADGAAYVIYTSGSTGKPKGVIGLHRGTVNRIAWMKRIYPYAPGEIACQKTALGFVDSIAEIFAPLLAGIPSVILADHVAKDPWRLVQALSDARVTRIVLVPSLLRELVEVGAELSEQLPHLNLWVTSGETLTVELARRFGAAMPQARLVNLYGCSEVAADATCYEVPAAAADLSTIPIGRPIDNTAIYILDGCRMPVPVGVTGEIYVGGDGLAGGYLGQPVLTAERFMANPFDARDVPHLYRTGDLGRFRADGEIVFMGRNDHQVKIRGVRIEVSEVEAALESHPHIRSAAVVASDEESGERRLVAFFVPEGSAPSRSQLRSHLSGMVLPQMVPTTFIPLQALPLTPSGKLDRRALPAPNGAATEVAATVEAPRDPTEEVLSCLWAELLRLGHVGINDNFFDIGGHSLLAVRLFARIHETFGVKLPVAMVFEAPTVARLAHLIRERPAPVYGTTLVPMQPLGELPPVFFVPGLGNEIVSFAYLARRLAPDRPVFGLLDSGDDGGRSIDELADEFARKIRGFRPEGPYHLGGYSSGATVAIEVARRLRAQGAAVGIVAILDHANPTSGYLLRIPWRPSRFARFLSNLIRWRRELGKLDPSDILRAIPRKTRFLTKALAGRLRRFGVHAPPLRIADFADPKNFSDSAWERMEATYAARSGYEVKPYAGPLTLFQTELQPVFCSFDPHLGWSEVATGGLEVHVVPGNHFSFLHEPMVGVVAERLRECLARAEGSRA